MAWRRHLLPKGLPLALAGGAIAAAVLLGVDSQQQARTQPPAAPLPSYSLIWTSLPR